MAINLILGAFLYTPMETRDDAGTFPIRLGLFEEDFGSG